MSKCRHGEIGAVCYLCKVLKIEELEAELVALRKLSQAVVSWPDSSSAQAELAIALWAAEEAEVKDE